MLGFKSKGLLYQINDYEKLEDLDCEQAARH